MAQLLYRNSNSTPSGFFCSSLPLQEHASHLLIFDSRSSRRCSAPLVAARLLQCRSAPRLFSSSELSASSRPSPPQFRSACSFARPPASPPQTAVPIPSSRHPSSQIHPADTAPFLDSQPAGCCKSRTRADLALSHAITFFTMEKTDISFSDVVGSNAVNVAVIIVTLLVLRIVYVLFQSGKPLRHTAPRSLSTLIVLGSGGHTAEMLNVLSVLQKDRFMPRFYIAAATDNMSLQKARVFEGLSDDQVQVDNAKFMQIYRSREVGQSYVTSVGTTLIAIAHALWLMIRLRPQVILCNGPGTCIPLCGIAFLFKVIGIQRSCIFYIESIARVRRLSLSGLLLYKLRIADQLYVQWPQLQKTYPHSLYVGPLM